MTESPVTPEIIYSAETNDLREVVVAVIRFRMEDMPLAADAVEAIMWERAQDYAINGLPPIQPNSGE